MILAAPLNNQFSIYGRAGVSSTNNKSNYSRSASDTKTEGLFGIGVGYAFAGNLTGTLEYQKLVDSNISAFGAGVKFSF